MATLIFGNKSRQRKASIAMAMLLSLPFAVRVLANEWTTAIQNGQTIGLNCNGTAGLLGKAACNACGWAGCNYAYSDSSGPHEGDLLNLCLENAYAECGS